MNDVSPHNCQALWQAIKQDVINRLEFSLSLADALNAVSPILLDEDVLVLGFPRGSLHHSGILLSPDKKNAIEKSLRERTGRDVSFQCVEGTSLTDWTLVKERQQQATAHLETRLLDRKQQNVVAASLDEVLQELHRRFSALEGRGFPQVKSGWLLDVIPEVVAAEARLRGNDEQFLRQYARIIDRLATMTDTPPTVVALEIERYKRAQS